MNSELQEQYTIVLTDLGATMRLAAILAKLLKPGLIIYLQGNLGAGKTTLVRNILESLGHVGSTKSPTFTLIETYNLSELTLHHFDLYRLADPSELEFIGIRDHFVTPAVGVFEWPEKGEGYIPDANVKISIDLQGETRIATIEASTTIIKALQDAYSRNP